MNKTQAALLILAGLAAAMSVDCGAMNRAQAVIIEDKFGTTPDGKPVTLYTLKAAGGMEAKIITYGGIVMSLKLPGDDRKLSDVVLGHDKLEAYFKNDPYFGALIGRYGNRIAGGKFSLNGKRYSLAQNNGPNSLHGGLKGFDKVVWKGRPAETVAGPALELTYTSPAGEEGFPGKLEVTALYSLTEDNALRIDFKATTDADTVCNLTHHSYFNLGDGADILGHQVQIDADRFTTVDKDLIPTGELKPVAGTPFDFRQPTAIGARIDGSDEQLKFGGGYDHNWVLNKPAGQLGLAARVVEPSSGRILEVLTTEPGLQFYTGNFLEDMTGKGGKKYGRRAGFCMEPQHFPDSPNRPSFPSTVLKPDQTYENTIIYRFPKPKGE